MAYVYRLHLGIYFNNPNKLKVNDCVSDEFYNMFRTISRENTNVYDEVFKCLPSDNILNFVDLTHYMNNPCLSRTNPVQVGEILIFEKHLT